MGIMAGDAPPEIDETQDFSGLIGTREIGGCKKITPQFL
jgi:hypothetical protein